jgi:phenylalanyl-tRNA synthetase beta chain
VFFPEKKKTEDLRLAGVYYNRSLEKSEMFYKAKEKIEAVLKKSLKQEIEFKSIKELDNNFFHLTRTADIFVSDIKIGNIGEINPYFSQKNKIKKPLIIFELNFDELYKLQNQKQTFKNINRLPFVERDLAIFVDPKTEVSEVEKIIEKTGESILKEIKLFDIFEDKKNNKKSFAFHLKFGKENETLKGEEVDERIKNIMEVLEREGYEIRR